MAYRPPFARMRQIKAQAAEARAQAPAPAPAPEPEMTPTPVVAPESEVEPEVPESLDAAVEFSTLMKKADLLSAASQMGVVADESMTKAQIVAALKAAQAG